MMLIGPIAKIAEDAGFESCWTTETTNTAFITAAAAIMAISASTSGLRWQLAFSPFADHHRDAFEAPATRSA